jgi:hypothetical protein
MNESKIRQDFQIPPEFRCSIQSTTEIVIFDKGNDSIYVSLKDNSAVHSYLLRDRPGLPMVRKDESWPKP